ncbi:phosphoribosylaminoimidazolesuccinocarboxamide synthase [Prosthecomicrobium pneumaticum]|uniref:Phosphoribosylaminoimidazole-succinocarboxamide synthase n=1 Tax=Prosthecomicrobium pneumaticum TaxID=81895 RepID=A0A7W9FM55_9HYPH|nr:phosphoribosylaminoimidazolesuccinocarboxamide synthase [Prosthecomicrobium pneumaticum]MBB5753131.1 phosphoribosylaminoimidazole-succinocarboxamide synthase [Prosthecomicrobium pneumaticum]
MKRWSTKTPRIEVAAGPGRTGRAIFSFTDDFSVFHFSKMPDQIPGKGEVVARMGHASLKALECAGIHTHMIGFRPPRAMEVRLVNVLDPAERPLGPGDTARLVPLQVIYRNRLGPGASVYRRAAAGRVTPADLGLDVLPPPDAPLARPILEFTTKLETIDRFVREDEARAIAGLTPGQFETLKAMTLEIDAVLSRHAAARGLVLADGKVEFALDEDGALMLVDVAGTPDENRFVLDGIDVSKQILRDFYHGFGLEAEVQRLAAAGVPRPLWPSPPRLPPVLTAAVAELYRALCERWTSVPVGATRTLEAAAAEAVGTLARVAVQPVAAAIT